MREEFRPAFSYESIKGTRHIVQEFDIGPFVSPPIPERQFIMGSRLPREAQMFERQKLHGSGAPIGLVEAAKIRWKRDFEHLQKMRKGRTLTDNYWALYQELRNKMIAFTPGYKEFVDKEKDRRENGLFFMNNGLITYMTGKHYMQVQHYREQDVRFDYRDINRELWYQWDLVVADDDYMGLNLLGPRRLGKTSMASVILIDDITQVRNVVATIQSTTTDTAKDAFNKTILAWGCWPWYFKPLYGGSNNPKGELLLSTNSAGAASEYDMFGFNALSEIDHNSRLNYLSSSELGKDGGKVYRAFVDEWGKTVEVDVNDRHNKMKETMRVNGQIYGKMFSCSTVEKLATGDAYENAKVYWNNSKPFDKSVVNPETGKPIRGSANLLYSVFVPATKVFFNDKHGYPQEKRAWEHIVNQRLLAGQSDNENDLPATIRQTCCSVEEAFLINPGDNGFNAKVLRDRLAELEASEPKTIPYELLRGEDEFGKIVVNAIPRPAIVNKWGYAQPDPRGIVHFSWMPPAEELNQNKIIGIRRDKHTFREYNVYAPVNPNRFAMATDPIRKTGAVQGSNAAVLAALRWPMGGTLNNPDGLYPCQLPFLHLLCKPTTRAYQQLVMDLCLFLGCRVLIEENAEAGLQNTFESNGMERYIAFRPAVTMQQAVATVKSMRNGNEQKKGQAATALAIKQYYSFLQVFVEDKGHLIDQIDLVKQLMGFDPEETKKYDLAVCMGWLTMDLNDKLKPPPAKGLESKGDRKEDKPILWV